MNIQLLPKIPAISRFNKRAPTEVTDYFPDDRFAFFPYILRS